MRERGKLGKRWKRWLRSVQRRRLTVLLGDEPERSDVKENADDPHKPSGSGCNHPIVHKGGENGEWRMENGEWGDEQKLKWALMGEWGRGGGKSLCIAPISDD